MEMSSGTKKLPPRYLGIDFFLKGRMESEIKRPSAI